MGIGPAALNVLKGLAVEGVFASGDAIFGLGAQDLHCEGSENVLAAFAHYFQPDLKIDEAALARLARNGPAGEFFRLSGFEYGCLDSSGKDGAIDLDLNFDSVPADQRSRYQLVTNFGTTEHVVNQLNAFKVMHDLTRPGGYMVHNLPMTGYVDHGMFTYNPKFFLLLRDANDYQLIFMCSDEPIDCKFPKHLAEEMSNFERIAETILPETFLWILYQKIQDEEFVPPSTAISGRTATPNGPVTISRECMETLTSPP